MKIALVQQRASQDREANRRLGRKAVDGLAEEPRPQGARKLTGREEIYRIGSGQYRVIYTVHDQDRLVLIVMVGARKDVYRRTRGQ